MRQRKEFRIRNVDGSLIRDLNIQLENQKRLIDQNREIQINITNIFETYADDK